VEELRTFLQEVDDSGYRWQVAQGWLYTDGLSYAKPAHGLIDLCQYLRNRDFELFIVSHKTTHTPIFCGHKELRNVASNWIANGDLSHYFYGTENIYFENSRDLKINRIKSLNLHYFVDDLVQIFEDSKYPQKIISFLLSTKPSSLSWIRNVTNFVSIKEILINEY
jgi:hypothetical protein